MTPEVAAEIRRENAALRSRLHASKQEAAKIGVKNVYWMTHETNTTARKLYDYVARRTGFIEYDLL